MKIKKYLYLVLGFIGIGLGAVGAVVPMLPAFPFLMLAAFCFARSSKRLNQWLKGTKLYKNNLEDYVTHRGMTQKAKLRIMTAITMLMGVGFLIMGLKGIVSGCIVLGSIWLFHVLYFCFGVKTLPTSKKPEETDG